jgi:hypothetical protein
MTPATEALVERLEERAASYRQGGPSSEHTAALLDDAAATIRFLSADHVSDPRQMVSPPPAGEE